MATTPTAVDPHPLLHWWRNNVVARVDHVAVVQKVEAESGFDGRYVFMILMSAGIAVLGLLLSSPAVVIGAMLISPLMGPIIGLGFGIATFDSQEIRRALTALALGTLLAILFCAGIVLASPLQTVTSELAARTRPNLFDLLVALFSALAGAYAMIRGREGTIVGVAIATALMPPLATVGFGLATWNGSVFFGALLLFFTNFMVIALSAAVMARLYGFGPRLSPRQTLMQSLAMLGIFAALAVPLAYTLRQIAWESTASRFARDSVAEQFDTKARIDGLELDFASAPLAMTATVLTPAFVAGAEGAVQRSLSERLGRPVRVSIEQFRVGTDDAEAAQLQRAQASERATGEAAVRIAERLALVAGVQPQAVLVDTQNRRAMVQATTLAGAALDSYRLLERRVAATAPGWRIELVPPPVAPGPVTLVDGVPDAAGQATLATAGWAAQRLRLPIGVAGDGSAAIAEALRTAGAAATVVDEAGPLTLSWQVPTPQ